MRASLTLFAAAVAPMTSAATQQPAEIAPGPALPRFAAELAQMPMIVRGAGWHGQVGTSAWAGLARAKPERRQAIRWDYALGLLGEGRAADAIGVLEVMRTSDRDLELVSAYQLARGAALVLLGRDEEALAALAASGLSGNPEACAWRLRAFSHSGAARDAIAQVNCALPAINGRTPADRAPFVLAAASAAIDAGKSGPALGWLALFPDQNAAANVLRGRALLAQRDMTGSRLRFERAVQSGSPEIRADARLGTIEVALASGGAGPGQAMQQLDALRFGWRGGAVERRALAIEYRVSTDAHDLRRQLRSGATLLRYFKLGKEAGPILATLQASLTAALAPESGIPLPDAAGLYWDYRELAPGGAEGDLLVLHLADRLQAAGLYARAAELLQYQLTQRAQDVAQGPLSVKVAALHILAGRPDLALQALQATEQPGYTDEMRWDRKRMEAVALHRLGKDDAAAAALDGVPDARMVRAEIHWRARDWGAFATEAEGNLPAAGALDEPQQAAVLRYAVALAMLGREDRLGALRARYGAAFRKLPSAGAFDVLTGSISNVDPARIAAAMAAIPQASPAGTIGDLLDAGS